MDDDGAVTVWTEFAWPPPGGEEVGPLCVAGPGGPTSLECRIEGGDFSEGAAEAGDELVIWAYNVERGLRLDDQLRALTAPSAAPPPDIVLLSEADRGCSRSGGRNVARAFAEALGMYYVFGVEFVELPRVWGPGGGGIRRRCEHGNAIISRYPLGNVRLVRHGRTRSWYSRLQRWLRVGQPRLGGRVAVAADALVAGRLLRLYAVHFESGRGGRGRRNRDDIRKSQAAELIADASGVAGGVVIGGDMNVVGYLGALRSRSPAESTTATLFAGGFRDAHADLPPNERITSDSGIVIDLIFSRGIEVVDAAVAGDESWVGLSDHVPIWARFRS